MTAAADDDDGMLAVAAAGLEAGCSGGQLGSWAAAAVLGAVWTLQAQSRQRLNAGLTVGHARLSTAVVYEVPSL